MSMRFTSEIGLFMMKIT
ncbi:hypothetical protein E2C01_045060 [Portunus trituberculatus]|uniref:Uncharacterized protein n=1 Tax=Portunus trituberculatus TaxID=210409 RepID=A0A5B7G0S7_PORTR|nr:hypothetical protein [Portunus trituberculatus]